jgi:hypothetical protein
MPATRDVPPGSPSPADSGAMRSPLASTSPPPLSLEALRSIAEKPGAVLPPGMLTAMRAMLCAQGNEQSARELETLFDLETGRSRAR